MNRLRNNKKYVTVNQQQLQSVEECNQKKAAVEQYQIHKIFLDRIFNPKVCALLFGKRLVNCQQTFFGRRLFTFFYKTNETPYSDYHSQ